MGSALRRRLRNAERRNDGQCAWDLPGGYAAIEVERVTFLVTRADHRLVAAAFAIDGGSLQASRVQGAELT